jgi:hypothetical protein
MKGSIKKLIYLIIAVSTISIIKILLEDYSKYQEKEQIEKPASTRQISD